MRIDRDAFQRDGYICARSLYSESEATSWKKDVVARMHGNGFINDPSGVHVWMSDVLDAYELQRMRDDRVVDILKQLIGSDVEFLSVKAVFKNAATTFNSPWHQDWHYWGGATKISVWIALDDATPENGCLQVMPSSHKEIRVMSAAAEGDAFVHQARDEDLPDLPIVTLEAKRGDAIFFHDLLMHCSHPNTSGEDRWAFISTYRDASVPDDSEIWQTAMLVSGETVNA